MKIITILGKGFVTPDEQRAYYVFDSSLSPLYSLKKDRYTNMLPLFLDNFSGTIIPIFTKDAKESQSNVLMDEFGKPFTEIFREECYIEDEKDFYALLAILNQQIEQNEEYIIDLTHGFRHIPILATISLITHNIKDTSNIKHIFFAKEIEAKKRYEIIDLKEYLELANMSYMLETFIDNYTVSSKVVFSNEMFQELSDELRIFSNHILSNSLIYLFESNHLEKLLKNIDSILEHKEIATFKDSLIDIKAHIQILQELNSVSDSRRFFELSKLLNDRGYLLNAITLLFEAIGHYCAQSFKTFDESIKKHIEFYELYQQVGKYGFDTYELTHNSRTFVKNFIDFKGNYLYNPQTVYLSKEEKKRLTDTRKTPKKEIANIHKIMIETLKKTDEMKEFQAFIVNAEALRNNLAHGNSSTEVLNAQSSLTKLIKAYELLCIQKDILNKKKK